MKEEPIPNDVESVEPGFEVTGTADEGNEKPPSRPCICMRLPNSCIVIWELGLEGCIGDEGVNIGFGFAEEPPLLVWFVFTEMLLFIDMDPPLREVEAAPSW